MAVFRIEKTRDYTVMSNHHLRDKYGFSAGLIVHQEAHEQVQRMKK